VTTETYDGRPGGGQGLVDGAVPDALQRRARELIDDVRGKLPLARELLKDCATLQRYRETSWLAGLNNERPPRNPEHAERLRELRMLVLCGSAADAVIAPAESQFFGFLPCDADGYGVNRSCGGAWPPGALASGLATRRTAAYAEDWLGLRSLDEAGRLLLLETDMPHTHLEWRPSQRLRRFFEPLAAALNGSVAEAERAEAAEAAAARAGRRRARAHSLIAD
jgi:palmitoyl-protein thioesterase